MTTARLLRATIALLTLLAELRYTMSRLSAASVLPAFLAKFQLLRDQWNVIQAKEISFSELISDALAQVDIADDKLDDFARRFSQAVLVLTGQKRDAALYVYFFKKPLAQFLRPTLSGQLAAMESWITSLQEPATHASLVAMLPELIDLVNVGKQASDSRDDLKLKAKQFHEIGERRLFVDQINALRKELYGALAKLALETPGFPSDFADHFFKPADSTDPPEDTVDSVTKEIATLEQQLLDKKARLVVVQKAADDAATEAALKATKQAQLDALNKEIEDKKKLAKELESEL
jgi:hypothetical protein